MEPIVVGSAVKLREDVLQRHSRSVPAHCGYTTQQFAWRDTIRSLAGKVGKVSRIFENSNYANVDYPNGKCIGINLSELVDAFD